MSNRLLSLFMALSLSTGSFLTARSPEGKPTLLILMGSVREQCTSRSIAHAIDNLVDHDRFVSQIVDPAELNLPMVDLELPQAGNPSVERWAEMVNRADAIIILTPNYNDGYSGITKNMIDSLSTQWNNKRVGLVGYAGGPDAKEPIQFLLPVTKRLGMNVLEDVNVYIPFADRSVNDRFEFKKAKIHDAVITLLNKIAKVVS